MSRNATLVALLLLTLALPLGAQSISTLFAQNNGGSPGGNVYFDLTVTHKTGIRILAMDFNCRNQTSPTFSITVYTTPKTSVGNETNQSLWKQVSKGTGVTGAADVPARVDLDDFFLPTGAHGIAITNSMGHGYTNGTGSNQTYKNADLTLQLGTASNVPFTATIFSPRVWNGTIFYTADDVPGFFTFGAGCKGSAGIPLLDLAPNQGAKLGTAVKFDLTNMVPASGAVMVVGGYNKAKLGPLPLPFDLTVLGMPGCNLYVAPLWTLGAPNIQGKGFFSLAIPPNPTLVGGWFIVQAAIMDPAANAPGVVFTRAGEAHMAR